MKIVPQSKKIDDIKVVSTGTSAPPTLNRIPSNPLLQSTNTNTNEIKSPPISSSSRTLNTGSNSSSSQATSVPTSDLENNSITSPSSPSTSPGASPSASPATRNKRSVRSPSVAKSVVVENELGKRKAIVVIPTLTFRGLLNQLGKSPKQFEITSSSGAIYPHTGFVEAILNFDGEYEPVVYLRKADEF